MIAWDTSSLISISSHFLKQNSCLYFQIFSSILTLLNPEADYSSLNVNNQLHPLTPFKFSNYNSTFCSKTASIIDFIFFHLQHFFSFYYYSSLNFLSLAFHLQILFLSFHFDFLIGLRQAYSYRIAHLKMVNIYFVDCEALANCKAFLLISNGFKSFTFCWYCLILSHFNFLHLKIHCDGQHFVNRLKYVSHLWFLLNFYFLKNFILNISDCFLNYLQLIENWICLFYLLLEMKEVCLWLLRRNIFSSKVVTICLFGCWPWTYTLLSFLLTNFSFSYA